MSRLRVAGVAVVALPLVLLTGCIPASQGAVRLNADGTVDYVVCSGSETITVDYWFDGESQSPAEKPEWQATPTPDAPPAPVVIRYGQLPAGYSQAAQAAAEPPHGWDWVYTPGGSFARSDLTEGEWYWNVESIWPWIPNHPCSGYEIGPDGEPRMTAR